MPVTYQTASNETMSSVLAVARSEYPEIAQHVTINVMMAFPPVDKEGEKTGHALKHNGWPAAAVVKINSLKDRAEGKHDVTIFISDDEWQELNARRREALIAHELHHITIVVDEENGIVKDDLGRPKLKLRKHDWQLSGFKEIAERYGNDALEVTTFREVAHEYRQMLFPWGDDMAGRPA